MAALNGAVVAWDVLMFLAVLLLLLTLIPPYFSRHVKRRKTWHSLILSLLVFSIGEVLLVGNQVSEPDQNLCLVQAAVIYSTPPFVAVSTAAYSADIYISIKRMFKAGDWEDGPEPQQVVILVLAPWITFFLAFLATILMVGVPKITAEMAEPGLYCHQKDGLAVLVSAVIVIVVAFGAISLQAATGWTLYHGWIKVQHGSVTSMARKYLNAFVRTIAFTVCAISAVILSCIATATVRKDLIGFEMLLPFFPIVSALIFGTYRDIMSFYILWR